MKSIHEELHEKLHEESDPVRICLTIVWYSYLFLRITEVLQCMSNNASDG
jgi:hypothetical protein